MKFKNSIKGKFLILAAISTCTLSLIVGLTIWKNEKIYIIKKSVIENRVSTNMSILKLRGEVEMANSYLLTFMFSKDKELLKNINHTWNKEINPLIEDIKLQAQKEDKNEISVQISSLLINLNILYFTQQEIITLISNNNDYSISQTETLIKSKLTPQLTAFNSIVAEIILLENKIINNDNSIAYKYENQLKWTTLFIFIVGVSLLGSFTYLLFQQLMIPIQNIKDFIQSISKGNIPSKLKPTKDELGAILLASNKLADNLENVKTFATEVGNGNFETNINVFNNEGDLGGSLAEMRQSLIKVAEEDKKRNWGTNGIAQIGEILRDNTSSPEELYLNIISFLVKYINANQGGMFLINSEIKDDTHLELVACYAFNRKKYLQKRIEIGEGLTGQAVLEKEVIYMTEIPTNYISITSGLGGANPRSILIVPLKVNEEIYGVIELASFHTIASHEIDLLKKLAENIASTISSVKTNERTKNLLDSSQQMTEQLRAQEEEMRQNVEELQATQEEMYRKQIEMDGQMSAINGIYLFIEFDVNGYIIHANELFQSTMKYSIDELRGKNHQVFIQKDSVDEETHNKFWEDLRKGISQSGEFKRITKEGTEVWLIANYSPVFDKSGELIKVITLASDISQSKHKNIELSKEINVIDNTYAIIEFNLAGYITKANLLFCQLTAYNESDLIEKHQNILIDDEFKNSDEYKTFWKDLANGSKKEGKYKLLNKNGNTIWVQGAYSPVSDINNNIYKIVSHFTYCIDDNNNEKIINETNKKLLAQELELKNNLEELKSIQETMQFKTIELNNQLSAINNSVPLVEFDLNGVLLDANKLFTQLFDFTLNDIVGKNFSTICGNEFISKNEYLSLWEDLKSNKSKSGNFSFINKGGQEKNFYATFTQVLNESGVPQKIICLFLYLNENNTSKEEIKKMKEGYEKRIKELESKLK